MGNYFYTSEVVETETDIPKPPVIATQVKEIQQSYQKPTLTKRIRELPTPKC